MGFQRCREMRITMSLQEASCSGSILVSQELGRDIDGQEISEVPFRGIEHKFMRHPGVNSLRMMAEGALFSVY